MTAPDRDLVRRKLATIVRNLRDLATVAGLDLGAYRADRFRQKRHSSAAGVRRRRRPRVRRPAGA